MKRIFVALFMFMLISVVSIQSVYAAPNAYLDPNTGSILAIALTSIIGGFSAIYFFFSNKIRAFFYKITGREMPVYEDDDVDDDEFEDEDY